MRFDVLTLFPEIFPGYLGQSLLNKAIKAGLVDVRLHNIRDWSKGKHNTVDDRPFGGGPGMVMKVEPVVECVEAVRSQDPEPGHLVMLTPQGQRLDQHAGRRPPARHGAQVLVLTDVVREGHAFRLRQSGPYNPRITGPPTPPDGI